MKSAELQSTGGLRCFRNHNSILLVYQCLHRIAYIASISLKIVVISCVELVQALISIDREMDRRTRRRTRHRRACADPFFFPL